MGQRTGGRLMLKWKDQKKLASEVGIHPTTVNAILNRRTRCPAPRAQAMSDAYLKLFGVYVPAGEFVLNDKSVYPIFKTQEAMHGESKAAAI